MIVKEEFLNKLRQFFGLNLYEVRIWTALLSRGVSTAGESVKRLEELKTTDVLKELDLLHKQGIEFIEPTDLSGAIRGRHNIYAHMESLIKNAENTVTIVTTGK